MSHGNNLKRTPDAGQAVSAAVEIGGVIYKPGTAVHAALTQMRDALQQDWDELWRFFNWFASGESQKDFKRNEPLAVLGDLYQRLAVIDGRRRAALDKLTEVTRG